MYNLLFRAAIEARREAARREFAEQDSLVIERELEKERAAAAKAEAERLEKERAAAAKAEAERLEKERATIAAFVRNNLSDQSDPDAIPRMSCMLFVDRTITDINIRDSTYHGRTALHYQSCYGTAGSVAWLLRQDPPANTEMRAGPLQWTALFLAACSEEDSEGKVRLLLDHGADRDVKDKFGDTALDEARRLNKHTMIDILLNYKPPK